MRISANGGFRGLQVLGVSKVFQGNFRDVLEGTRKLQKAFTSIWGVSRWFQRNERVAL